MGFFDLHEPEDGQDRFFLYAMIILPFCSAGSYLFDAWYHYVYPTDDRTYEGLLSTIVIVFYYLQYCVPIRSRKALTIYFILLCCVIETASMGYLLYYIKKKDVLKIVFYTSFLIIDFTFTTALIYCRVINGYESHIAVENKHLFHFMSRLEVLLTIFIPTYMNVAFTSLTRNVIAYFLLFDFFSDSYSRFQGVWIKSALYLFATTTTISIATEWFYFNNGVHLYEEISVITELIATVFCDIIIILQFFPFHFKTQFIQNIAKEALLFQRSLNAANTNTRASIAVRRASIAVSKAIDRMIHANAKDEEENDQNMNTAI
jgi:hypothetical protein